MHNWFHIFPKNTGLNVYVWIIFCILPFYFIITSSSTYKTIFGTLMILLFFFFYRMSFVSNRWPVYVWSGLQIALCILMTVLFGYVYFFLFFAFFIGNIQNKIGFFVLYTVHLLATIIAVNLLIILQDPLFYKQLPFLLLCIIGVILLPFNTYNSNKREQLVEQLEDANNRISELGKIEERQRIARDLHDTLGQKLSLIGLKSDLAGKLIDINPDSAKNEIQDIRQTARTALKEVRELVSDMRGTKLEDEINRVTQILKAAQIDFSFEGDAKLTNTPLLVENVVSMCLKEAVTNIVKHSKASSCHLFIQQSSNELFIKVQDNGIGMSGEKEFIKGHGLKGMIERLEFVNGTLDIRSAEGTTLHIKVPNVIM